MVDSSKITNGKHLSYMKRNIYALILLIFAVPAWSAVLEDVSYSALPGNQVQIVLVSSEPIGDPKSFATSNPPRLSIDLPDTTSALKSKTVNIGVGSARSLTAIQAKDRTRIVVNLVSSVPHEIKSEGNTITIKLGADKGVAMTSQPVSTETTTTSVSGRAIKGIDFRRGTSGEGLINVSLTDPSVVVDMNRRGEKIILDFINVGLPDEFARILDVTDFATPVVEIKTRSKGRNVQMAITAAGDYEHQAYQSTDIYTIEFKPLTKQEIEKKQLEERIFTGERLSLNFQDIEVRAVLQLLADFTGLNMVVSDTVGGSITLRLKNVPWDQAMDIILKSKGLSMRQTDNVIMVAPTEEITARERLELEAMNQIEELAPLYTELVEIKYAQAEDIKTLLTEAAGEGTGDEGDDDANTLLTERGSVSVDSRTNTLIILETAERLEKIRALIEEIDVPVRQVMIESRIVTADDSFADELGVRLGFAADLDSGGSANPEGYGTIGGGQVGVIKPPTTDSTIAGNAAPVTDLLVNLAAPGATSAVNLIVGKLGSYVLGLELSAMEQEGRGEIISSPRVVTSDQTAARISQGLQFPVQTVEDGTVTTEYVDAVIELNVTPHITPDNRVEMELDVKKDTPNFAASVGGEPSIDSRQLNTKVLVDNGETVILGGVYEQTKTTSKQKVPFFGDLPYVGWLFKQTVNRDLNNELLIFVTPKILNEKLSFRN